MTYTIRSNDKINNHFIIIKIDGYIRLSHHYRDGIIKKKKNDY